MKITFEIPDAVADRVLTAFYTANRFALNLLPVAGETKEDFFRRIITAQLISSVESVESQVPVEIARAQVVEQVRREIMIQAVDVKLEPVNEVPA